VVTAVVFTACDDSVNSLFDEDAVFGPQPVVQSMSPADGWLAGVDEVVISGQHFGTNPDQVFVFFDGQKALVNQVSDTELRVRPPVVVGEDLPVQISTLSSDKYSEIVPYTLSAAYQRVELRAGSTRPFGVTTDPDGNIFMYAEEDGASVGVLRRDVDTGEYSVYASVPRFNWRTLRYGSDGSLYLIRPVVRAIFRIPPGGGALGARFVAPNGNAFASMDFDPNGNAWAVGSPTNIFRFDVETAAGQAFEVPGNWRGVRYYNNNLYVVGNVEQNEVVWRIPINANNELETPVELLNYEDGGSLQSIQIADDGEIFVALSQSPGFIRFFEGESVQPLYPGVLDFNYVDAFWASGTEILVTMDATPSLEEERTLRTVNVLKDPSPYYGF